MNNVTVTLELIVVEEQHLNLVRQVLPDAAVVREIVWDDDRQDSEALNEQLPLLNGHPRAYPFGDPVRAVVRATCSSVGAAHEACRLLPRDVVRNVYIDLSLTEDELEAVVEHHSRSKLNEEFVLEQGTASTLGLEWLRRADHRLMSLSSILGAERVATIFEKVKCVHDPRQHCFYIPDSALQPMETFDATLATDNQDETEH